MFTQRLGTFLFVIGVALVGLFILSDYGDKPEFGFFFLGVVCVLSGAVLWWRSPSRGAPPAQPSGRFRMVKSLMNRSKAGKGGKPGAPPPRKK